MNKDNEEHREVLPGYRSIKDFTQDGFRALVEATRNANALPQERNRDFYNTHEAFRNIMNDTGESILRLINGIIREQGVLGSFANRDLDEKIELIVETNDVILERAAINLDEVNGIRKNPEMPLQIQEVSAVLPVSGSWNKIKNITVNKFDSANQDTLSPSNAIRLITGNNIQRPQKFFKDIIDNSNKFLWEPRIKEKPNSLKPLAVTLEENEDGTESFSHPYEFELDRFTPSADLLKPIEPVTPKPVSETRLCMVESAEELGTMLADLRKFGELAVDLEHHSYRSFLGITCLMQISTRDTDYLIDTLALRDKLWILNEVFTKPTIVKIFHGAEHDVEWLQRDLSLYVVNMFDTFQAAKSLGFEQRSLAYLLKMFCQVDANKHFQLADWRIRPLPEELKLYAREDTHYLIYIYHKLRNELIKLGNKNPHILKSVIDRSTEICKKRYVKPVWTETSHMVLYRRCKKMFDNKQMYALKELYKWRDALARSEDESFGYVLPNHMLLQIAEILPREMQGVLACCNPIPPLVRANLLDIHKIILKAREQSLVKPILTEAPRTVGSIRTVTRLNVENVLHCPHDTSNTKEFRDDLPTLLGDVIKQKNNPDAPKSAPVCPRILATDLENLTPILNVFENIEYSLKKLQKDAIRKVKKLKFLGPYERYKLVKPYIQAEEDKKSLLLSTEKIVERTPLGELDAVLKLDVSKDQKKDQNTQDQKRGDELKRKVTRDSSNLTIEIKNDLKTDELENIKQREQQMKSERQLSLTIRQMHGCKRKYNPSPDQTAEENNEEDRTLEEIVAPLSDVRPGLEHINWGNALRNNKRKKKQKKQNAKRQKLDSNQQNVDNKQWNQHHFDQQPNDTRRTQQHSNIIQQPTSTKQMNNNPDREHMKQLQIQRRRIKRQQKKLRKRQTNNDQKQNNRQESQQKMNKPNVQAFDYSSINYQQFEGGAGSVNNTTHFKTNFKGKNKSKVRGKGLGKGNNKSSFFGMKTNMNDNGRR